MVGKEGADNQRLINIFVVNDQGRQRAADNVKTLESLDQLLLPEAIVRAP